MFRKIVFAGMAALTVGVVSWRFKTPDPRDTKKVEADIHRAESESFHDRLRRGDSGVFAWPGLASAQVSWIWLEMLNELHKPESYKGDFSWMFSKLNSIVTVSNPRELSFIATLAPFYFVIGEDYAGATLVMNEMVRRAPPEAWRVWFWSGYHAFDNLHSFNLAGDLVGRAAMAKDAPPYFAALSVRLSRGQEFLSNSAKREILERELPAQFVEKVKLTRPEWFKD